MMTYDEFIHLCVGIHNELCTERQKVAQLQTDFDYNLSLLSERDLELSRYESVFTELKRVVNSLLAENSELKVCWIDAVFAGTISICMYCRSVWMASIVKWNKADSQCNR